MQTSEEIISDIKTDHTCVHCFDRAPHPYFDDKNNPFCCNGCKSVYTILQENNLSEFYNLQDKSDIYTLRNNKTISFTYLDNPETSGSFVSFDNQGNKTLSLYLEGVHCIACLWLIEKLPELNPNIIISTLNFGSSVVKLTIHKDACFSEAATLLNKLGYRPHLIRDSIDAQKRKKDEETSLLLKIGTAAAATMNIMLYSVSVYSGADAKWTGLFSWISLSLSIPVVFYSAIPFYKSAISAVRAKTINLDIPIVIAIILGTGFSFSNILNGSKEHYLDSLSVLIFLLLSSRYFLKKIQDKVLNQKLNNDFFNELQFHKYDIKTKEITEVSNLEIKPGDYIKILPGEKVPADGIIYSGNSFCNNALLTGESYPEKLVVNDKIFSGSIIAGEEVIIKIIDLGEDTKFGKMLISLQEHQKEASPLASLSSLYSKYLIYSIVIISIPLFFITQHYMGLFEAINRTMALVIITCPCALGLATPLAFSKGLSLLIRKGIFCKSQATIEKLGHAKNVFLDKTGTITDGQFNISNIDYLEEKEYVHGLIWELEKNSTHPIAKSLLSYLERFKFQKIELSNTRESFGDGVYGERFGHQFSITAKVSKQSGIILKLKRDETLLAILYLKDQMQQNSLTAIQKLKHLGLPISIISGDSFTNVKSTGEELGLDYHSNLSPEDKSKLVLKTPYTVMIGDGVNDGLALKNAFVGISVKGGAEASLQVADVYLEKHGLNPVIELFTISKEIIKIVKRNLVFSLLYNLVGVFLAIAGFMNPLGAAILMPLSSLTVILSTVIGTKQLRNTSGGI